MALPLDLPLSEMQGLREDVPEGFVTIEATSITGFEDACKKEIKDRYGDLVFGPIVKRQGRVIFDFPLEQVRRLPMELRTVDNVYVFINLESGIPFKSKSLEENIKSMVEGIDKYLWTKGLSAWRRVFPDAPEQLSFRCTCYRSGVNHNFSSMDIAREVGGAINEKFKWDVKMKNFDLEVVVNVDVEQVYCTLSLNKVSLFKRTIQHFGPTTLRATICASLLNFGEIAPGDVVVDPMCGGGSIPLEGALAYPQGFHLGGEIHDMAIDRTSLNLKAVKESEGNLRFDACKWDVTRIPLRDNSVDVFVTDLPFGKRSGSRTDNVVLYPKIMLSMARVVRPETGRAVLLTQDRNSMKKAMKTISPFWKLTRQSTANIGGLAAMIFFFKRTSSKG